MSREKLRRDYTGKTDVTQETANIDNDYMKGVAHNERLHLVALYPQSQNQNKAAQSNESDYDARRSVLLFFKFFNFIALFSSQYLPTQLDKTRSAKSVD